MNHFEMSDLIIMVYLSVKDLEFFAFNPLWAKSRKALDLKGIASSWSSVKYIGSREVKILSNIKSSNIFSTLTVADKF